MNIKLVFWNGTDWWALYKDNKLVTCNHDSYLQCYVDKILSRLGIEYERYRIPWSIMITDTFTELEEYCERIE